MTFDTRSEKFIATLNEDTQDKARAFLEKCKDAMLPYNVKIISGTRTYDEQNILYAFGRSRPGVEITRARGGYSWHNFRMAFDIGCFNDYGCYVDDLKKTQEMTQRQINDVYFAAGEIGETVGLEWGGRWKEFPDFPHFQNNPLHLTMKEVREKFEAS